MQTVTVTRTLQAPPDEIREAMQDLEAFTRAAGFDNVTVDGQTIQVANRVGIAEIELELAVIDDPESALAYEQREGIFEEMQTTFILASVPDGTEVEATTDFALDVALVGDFLDATVIKRQRRKELEAQFDYLEETT